MQCINLFLGIANGLELFVVKILKSQTMAVNGLVDQILHFGIVIPGVGKSTHTVLAVAEIATPDLIDYRLEALQLGVEIFGARRGECRTVGKTTQCLGDHARGQLSGGHDLIERSILGDHVVERFAVLRGDGAQLRLEVVNGSSGRFDLALEFGPRIVAATAQRIAEQLIASVRYRVDQRFDRTAVEVSPEGPGFFEIAEDDLPGLGPSGTDGLPHCIDEFAERRNVGCGVLRILCHFDNCSGLTLGVSLSDEISFGIGTGDLFQGLGQHLSGQPLTLGQGLTERSILRDDGVDVRTEVLGSALQGVLEEFAAHTGVDHRIPVHQRDSTGGNGLRQLVHGRGGLRSRRARCGGKVGDTLDRGDGCIQIHTGSGERADVVGHLGEVIDGLIGILV